MKKQEKPKQQSLSQELLVFHQPIHSSEFRRKSFSECFNAMFFAVEEIPLGEKDRFYWKVGNRGLDLLQVSQPLCQHLYQHP